MEGSSKADRKSRRPWIHQHDQLVKHPTIPPWNTITHITTHATLLTDCSKKEDTNTPRKKVEETIDKRLKDTDVQIWNDGLVMENQERGGSGAVIIWNEEDYSTVLAPAGRWCSSYSAELVAFRIDLDKTNFKGCIIF